MEWYKDRDFPEVKSSNADIVAVIENPKQLQRVIDDHNGLMDRIREEHRENIQLKESLNKALDALTVTQEEWLLRTKRLENQNYDLFQILKVIASGTLPNGDHVEGSVYEFSNEFLNKLGLK